MMDKKKEELFWVLNATAEANENAPAGAYWKLLEDTVNFYNHDHNTNFDDNDTVHEWWKWANNINHGGKGIIARTKLKIKKYKRINGYWGTNTIFVTEEAPNDY